MVARPCRSRTRAYTAEGAHPGLRRCRLVPLPRGGSPRQRGSGSDESSPPAPRVESARNPSWFLQAVLTHFRSQAHRHLPAKARESPPPPPPSGLVASMGKLVRGRVPFIFITQVAIYCVLFIFQVFSLSIVILFYLRKP